MNPFHINAGNPLESLFISELTDRNDPLRGVTEEPRESACEGRSDCRRLLEAYEEHMGYFR
jgi:hypothetical protein